MPCLSPVVIQHANINQEDTNTPAPISKKLYIIFLAVSTIPSGSDELFENASVIYPHNNEKTGRAAPVIAAAMDPTIINVKSLLSANLKSLKKLTASNSLLRVGSASY
jgi:hypothetical protein